MLRPADGRVAPDDLRAPTRELAPLRGGIGAPEVGDVVHRPAERVDRVEGVAPRARQREERIVEVRPALPGEPRGDVGDHAVFLAASLT